MAETYDTKNPLGPAIVKDPSAILDYSVDITQWLALVGDSLSSFTVAAESPLTVASTSFALGVMTAWISGGLAGQQKKVTFHFVTAGGRTDERTIVLVIKNR